MKKLLIIAGTVMLLLIVAAVGAGLWLNSVVHEVPDFYAEIEAKEVVPEVRQQQAIEAVTIAEELESDFKTPTAWTIEFSQEQVNSWLIEKLPVEHPKALPPEVKDPRVRFTPGLVMAGAKINSPEFKGVIGVSASIEVTENDELVLTIESVQAGNLKLPVETTVKKVLEEAKLAKEIRVEDIDGRQRFIIPTRVAEEQQSQLAFVEIEDGLLRLIGEPVEEDDVIEEPGTTQETVPKPDAETN